MASPLNPYKPSNVRVFTMAAKDFSAVNNAFQASNDANHLWKVVFWSFTNLANAPLVALRLIISGVTTTLFSPLTATVRSDTIWIPPSGTFQFIATANAVGAVADVNFQVEEYEAA